MLCPVCSAPLSARGPTRAVEARLRCPQGHEFVAGPPRDRLAILRGQSASPSAPCLTGIRTPS
jgi:hypothetical protein